MSENKSKFTWGNPPGDVDTVTIYFEEEPCVVPAGITVAAALLGHGDHHFCRSAADRQKRAPYCLMGVCFECLVEINGIKNRQACLEPVVDGMHVKRQHEQVDVTP
jgi:predicted molibdopterin-dependent oxidoreductase YjgC